MGTVADLQDAIRVARKAVKATLDDHSARAGRLNNLGILLGGRFSRTGAIADLEESIRVARKAVKATLDGHSNLAMYWDNLELRLGDRFSHTGAMADLQEPKQNFRTALNSQSNSITVRIGAGCCFMSTPDILEGAPLACDIAKATIDLIPLSAPGSLTPAEKRHFLSGFMGFSSDAAAVELHVGQAPVFATELLETDRGVLASFLQDMRTDISLLRRWHQELAHSFTDLRNLLDPPAQLKLHRPKWRTMNPANAIRLVTN